MRLRPLMFGFLLCVLAPALAADDHGPPAQESVTHFSSNLIFWEYVTFALIVVVLAWKVIPVMLQQMAGRQERIKDALDKADQVRSEAEVLLKKHEEMMRDAHKQAQKVTDDAKAAGREAAARIHAAAEGAARELKERSGREIELMRQKMQSELREQAIELALLAGSRVLEKSLKDDDHRRLAREAIAASALMKN